MGNDRGGYRRAREETLLYHRELYATTMLGTAGTWLAAPQRSVMEAIGMVDVGRPVVAYDLGAGIGRHGIPLLETLPAGSVVIAVDLLPEALRMLRENAPHGEVELATVAADLDSFEFDRPADLVVAFSAIEHLPDLPAVRRLLARIAAAVVAGGIVHLGFVCDRVEIDGDEHRPALLESGLTSEQAASAVEEAFTGFDTVRSTRREVSVMEHRDARPYELRSTLVSFTLRRVQGNGS